MARIILNPENGATIQNVQIAGVKYFVEKPFEVDTMIKIEDDTVAEVLLTIYEFLAEMTLDEAKKYKEDKAKRIFKCTKCDMATTTQLTLDKHLEKHAREEQLDKELGIEVIVGNTVAPEENIDGQEVIDKQASADGLFGEGLVQENNTVGARF